MVLAAGVYFGSRLWLSSFFRYLYTLAKRGEYEAVALVSFCMYDETPLKLRQHKDKAQEGHDEAERRHHILKLMQCKVVFAISLKEVCCGRMVMLRLPVPTHLSEFDRATGENTKAAMQVQLSLPKVELFASTCPHVFAVMTGDPASSNDAPRTDLTSRRPRFPDFA